MHVYSVVVLALVCGVASAAGAGVLVVESMINRSDGAQQIKCGRAHLCGGARSHRSRMAAYDCAFLHRLRLLALATVQQDGITWLEWYAHALVRVCDPACLDVRVMLQVVTKRAKLLGVDATHSPVLPLDARHLGVRNRKLLEICLYWFARRPVASCELRDDLTAWGGAIRSFDASSLRAVQDSMVIEHETFVLCPHLASAPDWLADVPLVRAASPFFSSSPVGLIDA